MGRVLKEADMWNVVNYVRSIEKKKKTPKPNSQLQGSLPWELEGWSWEFARPRSVSAFDPHLESGFGRTWNFTSLLCSLCRLPRGTARASRTS